MTSLRCFVVDDEPLAVKMLENFIARTPFLELVASFTDPVLALSEMRTQAPDLVFLDIQMPDLSGMELSRMVPAGTRIIFTTAFKQYAFESYEVSALDFLLKPIRYQKFLEAAEKVQLASEIEFMDNYIDLMALRCNDLTTVEKHLEAPSKPVEVAPLLFISLVENAFKHGVNARHPSFVKVSMHMDGDDLVFACDNSLFEKQGTDHIGSGIGLENMKRRLELLYPGRYTYEQSATDDTYHVQVTLKSL